MISPDIRIREIPTRSVQRSPLRRRLGRSLSGLLMACCILLACIGASWFAFQTLLVPQPRTFATDWQGAQWVQAADTNGPIAYYRYATNFIVQPDGAFVTVTANQVFRLYVNGYYIGSNASDFVKGQSTRAYMYDVNTAIQQGSNVIGIRVANVDKQIPQVRATFGARWGKMTRYYGTGSGWVATGNSALAHPRSQSMLAWSKPDFSATSWLPTRLVTQVQPEKQLAVNPLIYTQSLPGHWLSSGGASESYFVRQVGIPANTDQALLRVIATGETSIFINDHLYMVWNGQVAVPQKNIADYLDDAETNVTYRKGLIMGVYDISPYLHAGTNTIALRVSSPGSSTAKVGLDTYKSALSLDLLVGGKDAPYTNLFAADEGWHASPTYVSGWTQANSAAFSWSPPTPVGRPGENSTSYLPDSNTPLNQQVLPPVVVSELFGISVGGVLVFWLLFGLLILGRFYPTRRQALEAASLVFLPALVVEAAMLLLTREPLLPEPFPYTRGWALLPLSILLFSAFALWYHARRSAALRRSTSRFGAEPLVEMRGALLTREPDEESVIPEKEVAPTFWGRLRALLTYHWAIIPVILIALPMIAYGLGYEPYWQDEFSSYNAARGIMLHGIPIFTSGFVYPKAELFSYAMAAWMFIFGTANPMPRMVSLLEYMLSIPLLYAIGYYIFRRRSIAWLAATMLAFSPYALIWGRQARMYEQAHLMTMVVLFAFIWAVQNRTLVRAPYLAVLALLVAYFSHEETFVIMPGLLLCILWSTREGRFGLPDVLRRKHWWFAALLAIAVIGTQLSIVFLSHPAHLGGDQSQRPQIQISTDNIPYYLNLLFGTKPVKDSTTPGTLLAPWIALNSILAVLGCVIALMRKERRARFAALLLILATLTLVFVFTMQADRYYYPLMSAYYLLAAYGFYQLAQALWLFARPYLRMPASLNAQRTRLLPGYMPLLGRIAVVSIVAILAACVLIAPMLPISNYNLFVSRMAGLSYHRHFADYDEVGKYMQGRLRAGDIVISVSPSISVQYYVGRVDHYFSIDRALFLIEKDGRIVETSSGAHPLLNQADFEAILARHARIWFVSDNGGYQAGVVKNERFTFPPPGFQLVFEGYGSAVYFRSAT